MLVRVQLRKQFLEGLILAIDDGPLDEEGFTLKPIEQIISPTPLLTLAHLDTMKWMADYYFCSLRSAMTPFLPSPPWHTLIPKDTVGYRLVKQSEKVGLSTEAHRAKVGKNQQIVLDALLGQEWMSLPELKEQTDTTSTTIKRLKEVGWIEEETRNLATARPTRYHLRGAVHDLTQQQREAYESMKADARPSLLFGITGSGKTEVYAKMIEDCAIQGKQSILLVPEILLTEHIITRFEVLFDRKQIAVLHSRLTPASRRKEWMKIRSGEAALIIGSRSALFAPCKNLGIVILDEEHEWTYKNEQTPRYHARETAEALCRFAKAKLVMGTATPSLETWARTKNGTYHLARLRERYKNAALPTVKIVDLGTVQFGSLYPFSPTLLLAIEERLQRGEQTVLFLNRRGIASAMMCLKCRKRLVSPETQLPFTVHKNYNGTPYLLDHFSGVSASVPAACPNCGAHDLLQVGAGTQKIEDLLLAKFPRARLLRADSDTLQSPEDMRELLRKMRDREADILLGTQSVVKGLDLPGITLAAVLIADIGLSLPHFRAGERVFQLLTQLTGRSGRVDPGEVIIQTFRPDSVEVIAASQHRTEDYMEAELTLRQQLQYPPFTQMIRFIVREEFAESKAKKLHASILRSIHDKKIQAQAMVAPTLFGGGKVWHVLLRGEHIRSLLPVLDLSDAVVDIDPIDCI
jgi:primosomal protein N' (replication factor Y)